LGTPSSVSVVLFSVVLDSYPLDELHRYSKDARVERTGRMNPELEDLAQKILQAYQR